MKIIKNFCFYLCISLYVINFSSCKEEKKVSPVSLRFPDGQFQDMQQEMQSRSMADGTVRLVVFWATWCQPCLMEIPSLIELHKELAGQPFEILALSVDEEDPFKKVVQKIAEYQIPYTVLHADNTFQEKIGGIQVLPTSYLIDGSGMIQRKWYGPQTKFRLYEEIKKHLPQKTPA